MARRRAARRATSGADLQLRRGRASTAEHEVRAVVEAKLLGMRLLSLKAHVVTGTPSSLGALTTLTTLPPATEGVSALDERSNGSSGTLSDAIELLSQSSGALQALSRQRDD